MKPQTGTVPPLGPLLRARVLIIDDDPILLAAFGRVLGKRYHVRLEPYADNALRSLAAGERFDAILCDVTMPGVGGLTFYERAKEIAPAVAMRIVFMTGGASTAAHRALEALPNLLLWKPVPIDELRSAIEATVGGDRGE